MKKFSLMIAVLIGVYASQAAYLYWQVDTADFENLGLSSPVFAQVIAVPDGSTSGSALNLVNTTTREVTGGTKIIADSGKAVASLDTIVNPTSYSFFIELLNYNSSTEVFDAVGRSQTFSYAQLQGANYIDVGETMQIPTAVWHGGSFTAVPEPTSAMMVMMGLGLLALKRRKV